VGLARGLLQSRAVTDLDIPVGLLAVLRPEAVRLFDAIGIDLTLEHARPFEEACAMRDIDPRWAMRRVVGTDVATEAPPTADWSLLRDAIGTRAWDLDALA